MISKKDNKYPKRINKYPKRIKRIKRISFRIQKRIKNILSDTKKDKKYPFGYKKG